MRKGGGEVLSAGKRDSQWPAEVGLRLETLGKEKITPPGGRGEGDFFFLGGGHKKRKSMKLRNNPTKTNGRGKNKKKSKTAKQGACGRKTSTTSTKKA